MKIIAIASVWLLATCASAQPAPKPSSVLIEPESGAVSGGKLLANVGFTTPAGGVIPVLARGCSPPCAATQVFEPRPGGVQVTLRVVRDEPGAPDTEVQLGTFRVTSAIGKPLPGMVGVEFLADEDGIRISAPGASPLVVERVAR